MVKLKLISLLLFISLPVWSLDNLRSISALEDTITRDLNIILKKANLTGYISYDHIYEYGDYAQVTCNGGRVKLKIYSLSKEWSSTFYYALQKLGFLFPHPRWQISPEKEELTKYCGKKFEWKPALKYRGFHFHTLHPNEWVHGFLQDSPEIAIDTIRWLARNQQNIFDLSLLRMPSEEIYKKLKEPFKLAKSFGIHAGLALGLAFHQQNSFKLVSILGSFSDDISRREIARNLANLLENIDISYLNIETGTSEFTAVNYDRTLKWLNQIAKVTKKKNVKVMTKVHISTNQKNKKYGNYNFLPAHADNEVGILPHTVFYYSLNDESAPMYGNKNFSKMRDFMLEQNEKRRTWFYPETSYFIAMDIGLPLYFTEYLRARAEDMSFIHKNSIEGQLTFTTGQENGYWLFDWTVALLNNLEYKFDPLIGAKLLGEDPKVFQKHIDFQNKHFTQNELTSVITFQNMGDELFPEYKIHKRILIKDLMEEKSQVENQIYRLANAINEKPSVEKIKNPEIKTMLTITYLRLEHALLVRKAMLSNMKSNIQKAKRIRKKAEHLMEEFITNYERYPKAKIFETQSNLTSYQWGYGYTAKNLHHWRREEQKVKRENFSAFYMSVFDPLDILF